MGLKNIYREKIIRFNIVEILNKNEYYISQNINLTKSNAITFYYSSFYIRTSSFI